MQILPTAKMNIDMIYSSPFPKLMIVDHKRKLQKQKWDVIQNYLEKNNKDNK